MIDDDGKPLGKRWFDTEQEAIDFTLDCPLDCIIYQAID